MDTLSTGAGSGSFLSRSRALSRVIESLSRVDDDISHLAAVDEGGERTPPPCLVTCILIPEMNPCNEVDSNESLDSLISAQVKRSEGSLMLLYIVAKPFSVRCCGVC